MNRAEAQGGTSQSLWHATVEVKTFPRLLENVETEVVIIGAGLAGLTTAYLLAKEGKRVVVLDDGPIGGGETGRTTAHLTNEIDDRYYHVEFLHGEEGLKIAFTVRYRWSGQVMEPVDALAYLGKNPGDSTNTYIITGDSGMGMTNTTAGAMIVSDLVLGRENRWATLYDPSRKTLRAIPEFLKENLNVVGEFAEYVTAGDVPDFSKVAPGTGAIVRHGLKKLAVYRDKEGKLFTYSAKCPHLGCIVDWNSVESSWDCPCHGSRFTPKGEVMNGPALSGLTPEKIETQS